MFEQYDRAVRCKDGHLFTTIWMPLVSFKAARLGDRRYQRCPVGRHWTTVVPLDVSGGSPEDYEVAKRVHDVGIP
jgi:hypothetical protein